MSITKHVDKKPVVIITGSGGNIGTALTDAISDAYQVVGMDRDAGDGDIVADLSSDDSVAGAFREYRKRYGQRIAAVIHLAAYFDFTGEKSPLYDEVNVNGTRRLLKALQGFEVERFIYSGTMLVHEPGEPGDRINEDTPVAPKWAYPESKAQTEAVIRDHSHDIPFTLLHLAGLYDDQTAVPTLAHQIARIYERDMKAHLTAGDIDAGQSFIHIDDMLDVFRRCLDRRNELPAQCTILAGEPEVMSYRDLQHVLGKLIHGEDTWRTITLPAPVAKAGAWLQEQAEPVVPDAIDHGEKPFIRPFLIDLASDHYALDIGRAKSLLDWQPVNFIADRLPVMIAGLKKDPVAWYKRNGMRPPDWMLEAEEVHDEPEPMRLKYETWYRDEYARNLWGPWFNIGLGFWLMSSLPRLGYESGAMMISDFVSGAAIVILAALSLSWKLPAARWGTAVVGMWVMFAPLVFWTESPAVYLNGSLVGSLVVAFSVLLRPAPGISPIAAMSGPSVPPRWSYSPSSWFQRLPIIVLAFIGFFISSYMAAYQLGHIDSIWEPFFAGTNPGDGENGTAEIISSSVSEAWPVPDAGAGAMVYLMEILVGMAGSNKRWRTMPWLVTLFGIMIVPLGVVSITFIIIQPILLGTWCTLCLMAAAAMLLQIPFSLDELVATGQFLRRRHKQGQSWLRIFFVGDTDEHDGGKEEDNFQRPASAVLTDIFSGGVRLHWPLLLCVFTGVMLMLSRLWLGVDGTMANVHHLVGALVITVSITALAEVGRALRFLNIALVAALVVAAFVIGGSAAVLVATVIAALLIAAASVPRGPVRDEYGSWSRLIV